MYYVCPDCDASCSVYHDWLGKVTMKTQFLEVKLTHRLYDVQPYIIYLDTFYKRNS